MYVMGTFSISSDVAHHYVLTRRQCVKLNEGFRNQLREYEMLQKVHSQMNSGAFVPNPALSVANLVQELLSPALQPR